MTTLANLRRLISWKSASAKAVGKRSTNACQRVDTGFRIGHEARSTEAAREGCARSDHHLAGYPAASWLGIAPQSNLEPNALGNRGSSCVTHHSGTGQAAEARPGISGALLGPLRAVK